MSSLPLLVVEGGWTSASASSEVSSPDKPRRYLTRQAQLLDVAGALFLFQLTFTDLDLSSFPPPLAANLGFVAWLGLLDAELHPLPALAVSDSLYALRCC